MSNNLTAKQREALADKGTKAEELVKNWLEKRNYRIDYWHKNKKSNKPYDIKASKGKEHWVIDVKTGLKPSVNISNIEKNLGEIGYNKIGLALVRKNIVYLFEFKKMSDAGRKAALTKKYKNAGKESWETRRQNIAKLKTQKKA